MTSRWRALAFAAALGLGTGCFHTRKVGGADEGQEQKGSGGQANAPREKGSSSQATPSRVPPRGGRPAVSASPEELMNPGSARRIQDALRGRGYAKAGSSGHLDAATAAALRRFQHDQDLAETGAPDRETLRRLGIDPGTVYETARKDRDRGTPPGGADSARGGESPEGTGSADR